MKILLDTHCWLWALSSPERLSDRARELLSERSHELYLSSASVWEMAIKISLKKLTLPKPLAELLPEQLQEDGIFELAITNAHALKVATLPHHHNDPFDRLLVAQAQVEGLHLLTADPKIRAYEVDLIWAGEGGTA